MIYWTYFIACLTLISSNQFSRVRYWLNRVQTERNAIIFYLILSFFLFYYFTWIYTLENIEGDIKKMDNLENHESIKAPPFCLLYTTCCEIIILLVCSSVAIIQIVLIFNWTVYVCLAENQSQCSVNLMW